MRPAQELSLASLATVINSLAVMRYLNFGDDPSGILTSRGKLPTSATNWLNCFLPTTLYLMPS
jgi:hypothetical protein